MSDGANLPFSCHCRRENRLLFRRSRPYLEEGAKSSPGYEPADPDEQGKLDGSLHEFVAGSNQTEQKCDPHDNSGAVEGRIRGGGHIDVLVLWKSCRDRPKAEKTALRMYCAPCGWHESPAPIAKTVPASLLAFS